MERTDTEINLQVSSSSGREFLACRSVLALDEEVEVCEIEIRGRFWDRSASLSDAAIVDDFWIRLPQVRIDRSAYRKLVIMAQAWLDKRECFEIDLCDRENSDQRFMLSVGAHPEFICTREKPVLSARFSRAGVVMASCSFVVDQSCLEGAFDGARRNPGSGPMALP